MFSRIGRRSLVERLISQPAAYFPQFTGGYGAYAIPYANVTTELPESYGGLESTSGRRDETSPLSLPPVAVSDPLSLEAASSSTVMPEFVQPSTADSKLAALFDEPTDSEFKPRPTLTSPKNSFRKKSTSEQDDSPSSSRSSGITKSQQYAHTASLEKTKELGTTWKKPLDGFMLKKLLQRSQNGETLEGMNVCLFDSHEPRFANLLLKNGITGLSLVETAHANAAAMKAFATEKRKQGRNVQAFLAPMSAVIPLKSKKLQERNECRLLWGSEELASGELRRHHPLVLKPARRRGDESGDVQWTHCPILIGIEALPTRQLTMLKALQRTLIMHLTDTHKSSMFRYGPVELFTWLSAQNFALVACDHWPDERFHFAGRPLRFLSRLLNKLFELEWNTSEGQQRKSFDPAVPKQLKETSHEQHLEELDIRSDRLYPVAIRPRIRIQIGRLNVQTDVHSDSADNVVGPDVLVRYAFWQSKLAKLTMKANARAKLSEWFPLAAEQLAKGLGEQTKGADLSLDDLDRLFTTCHQSVGLVEAGDENGNAIVKSDAYRKFAEHFAVETKKEYAD